MVGRNGRRAIIIFADADAIADEGLVWKESRSNLLKRDGLRFILDYEGDGAIGNCTVQVLKIAQICKKNHPHS